METLKNGWGILRSLWLWVKASPSERTHIFITGAPRSGTTLMKTILTAHPAIAGGDYESTGLFRIRNLYRYSCGEIENGWIRVSWRDATSLTEYYDQLADALLSYYEGEHFVDKIWPRAFRLKYVTSKFPKARWIHIVRDGRDSLCSARKHPNVPQSSSVERFARYWQRANQLIEREVPLESRLLVRYEDLTHQPREEIRRVMDFLSIPIEEEQLHPAESGRMPSIRKRAYHSRLDQPINTRSVGRYEKEMSREERQRFVSAAWDTLNQYGYRA